MDNIVPQNDTPLKRCYKCKQFKPRTPENFGPDKRTLDGFRGCCKTCRHKEYEETLARNPNLHKDKWQKTQQDAERLDRERERQANYMRSFRKNKRSVGICSQCGKEPCKPGHYCDICQTKMLQYKGKYRQQWPKYGKNERDKLRKEVLEAYGGKCTCCGESHPEFLAIDHVNEDGAKHRRHIGGGANMYRWLRKQGFPKEEFQLLCHNCNFAKSKYEGGCPHQRHS